MCYSLLEDAGLFFVCEKAFPTKKFNQKTHIIRDGGENLENKNYLGLHRVQTEKLQYDQRQKSYA